jgi:MFS family permease
MLALFKQKTTRRFYLAWLQSSLGNGASYVALVLVAYHRMHSAWAISLVLLADFLPGIVLGPLFGAFADRYSRRRLAVGADLLRAVAFLALAVVSSFAATIALALVAGVGTALFRPAVRSALPELVDAEQRSPATALYGSISSFGVTLGPAITAMLLFFTSANWVLAANGVTFLISAALLRSVPLGRGAGSVEAHEGSVWSSTQAGARAAARIPGVVPLLIIGALSVLAAAAINVAEPLLATGPLHAGNSGYSVLVAVYGGAMVLGAILNSRMGSDVGELRRRLLIGVLLNGVGMLISGTAPDLAVAIVGFAVTGFSNALIVGPEMRLFQELVTDDMRGRVMGLQDMLENSAFVAAFLAGGMLLTTVGVRSVFGLGGGALLLVAAAGWWAFQPRRTGEMLKVVPELG